MRTSRTAVALGCAAMILAISACSSPATTTSSATPAGATGCISNFDPNRDYFPDKATTQDATNFTVEYHKSYKVVKVPKPNPSDPAATYVLVQCGAPEPQLTGDLAAAQKITVPVKRIDAASTTQIASLELLGGLDQLVGVTDADGIVSEKANALVGSGKVATFGTNDGGYDVEKIVATKPDVLFQAGMPSQTWTKLRELKVPSVADGSWLEASPLGRAEWIKYYSVFLGAEAKATQTYDTIRADYLKTRQIVSASRTANPSVLVGTEFKGTWTVPGADSYVGSFVRDAGGNYVFAAEVKGSGTQKMDQEKVLAGGKDADVWLNGNWMSRTRWKNKADALAANPRISVLKSVQNNAIWNPTKRLSPKGANDYWESGVVRPDLVLHDLAAIFHPQDFPGYTLYYYGKLAD